VRTGAIVPLLLLGILLAGCVTTTETVFTEEASPEKALETRVELARQYIGEGNWDDAKRNLAIAAEIDPDNAEVHEAFALVYQSTGEYELAEENFRRAIRLDRGLSRARNNYAAFLFSQGRYREAEQQLESVVADSLYEARPRAFLNLGLCRLQLYDRTGAEEAFVRSLSMERRNPIALLELAILRFDAGDLDSAHKYYARYRGVVPQQSARGLWLGVRLARATGDRNAEGSYTLALRNLYPDSPECAALQRSDADV
jgi:type IV pilus assembly protein PilF